MKPIYKFLFRTFSIKSVIFNLQAKVNSFEKQTGRREHWGRSFV